MIWGSFGKVHIATIIAAVLINFVLFLFLRKKSRKTQILILFALSIAGLGYTVYTLVFGKSIWENLPLHLFSLNAVLLPFAVLTRKKWACNLLLFWSVGAYIALILNQSMAATPIFSKVFVLYYAALVVGAGVPILLFALDLVDRDHNYIKTTLLITLVVYTFVHFVNLAINTSGIVGPTGEIIQVNYMFSMAPENQLLNFFHLLIPSPYWYMFLTLPLILVYLFWWYLPEMLDARRKNKYLRMKLKAIDQYYDEYLDEYVDEIIEEKYDD